MGSDIHENFSQQLEVGYKSDLLQISSPYLNFTTFTFATCSHTNLQRYWNV